MTNDPHKWADTPVYNIDDPDQCPPGNLLRGQYLCGLTLSEAECPLCFRYICPSCGLTIPWTEGGTDTEDCDECWVEAQKVKEGINEKGSSRGV